MVDFTKLVDRRSRPSVPRRFQATAERTMLFGSDPSGQSDRTSEVSVYLWLDKKPDGTLSVQLDGGPTGHESFVASPANIVAMQSRNWVACMGTRGRWDRLVVPRHEMKKFFSWAGMVLTEVA